MKTVFVILGVIFALIHEGTSDTDIAAEILTTVEKCVTEQNLDKEVIVTQLRKDTLPEDDEKFTEFFTCFTNTLGTVNSDGESNEHKLKLVLQYRIKKILGDVPDADAKALDLATSAIEKCRDTPKGDSVGLTAIKGRNCIAARLKQTEPR